jgi:hypothetical protein
VHAEPGSAEVRGSGDSARPPPRFSLAEAKRVALSTPLLGTLIAVLTWPFGGLAPTYGLDPSWIAGLYMAGERGLNAGTQIVFAYGPLGFLNFPSLFEIWPGRLAFAWSALAQAALCIALLWGSRRAFGLIAGLAVAICAAVTPEADPVLIAATVVGGAALLGDWGPRARLSLAVGAGALAGMQLLGSLRAGPTLVTMGIAVLIGLPDRRRTFPSFFGALVVAFAVFWLLTGQGLDNLGDYLANTASVVGGYSEAMVFPQPGRWWQVPAMILGVGTLIVLAVAAAWRRNNSQRAGLALLVGAVTFLMFKHAVVRESPGSVGLFLAALLAIGVALVPHVRRPLAIGAVVVLAGLAFLGNRDLIEIRFELRQHADSFVTQLGTVAIPGRAEDEQQKGREAMEAAYALTPRQLALLRTGTVHVAPWEAGAAWAYDLDWDPLPVFQQYSAYTQRLDELNAAKLESASAPDLILWQNTTTFDPNAVNYPGAIDARWPAFESPAQMDQMFCRYRAVQWDEAWAILRRSPDRCGRERPLQTVVAGNGQAVRLPTTQENEALFVRVDGLSVSGAERLRTLLFRAANRHVIFGPLLWNMVGATAPDGLLLRVSRWADYPGKFALSSGSPTVAFERVGGFLTGVDGSTKVTLHFYALPLDAPAVMPGAVAAQKRRVQR